MRQLEFTVERLLCVSEMDSNMTVTVLGIVLLALSRH